MKWENVTGHFETITNHKRLVMEHCFAMGLYRQGLMHDLSKYMPSEFLMGCKYYQGGKRSPNNGEREEKGFSEAWLHHKGRNKHHFEYWMDYSTDKTKGPLVGCPMPRQYVAEMLADRVAASKNYDKEAYTQHSPLTYFLKGRGKDLMHPQTERQIEMLLRMLDQKGEEATFAFVKHIFLKKGRK